MNKLQINNISIHRFFMRSCVWNFKEYPEEDVRQYFSKKRNTLLDLTEIQDTPLFEDIRDIFISIFVNKKPCSYRGKAFPSFMYLAEFMNAYGYDSFAEVKDPAKTSEEWLQFWSAKGKIYLQDYVQVINNSLFIINEFRDTRSGLDRNYWELEKMGINEERINKTVSNQSINFWRIQNVANRELVKSWMKYLVGTTELSVATITNHYSRLSLFVNSIGEKSLLDVTNEDIKQYRAVSQFSSDRNNHFANTVQQFYKFLSVKQIYTDVIPVLKNDYVNNDYTFKSNLVSQDIIFQLFWHIHELPDDYLLIFLIDLFTGIRISDICQLEPNCIYQNEHGYFLCHDVQKMQDVGGIPIAKELYELIVKRIKYIKSLDYEEKYLFPSVKKKNYPFNSQTYSNSMKRYVRSWGIKTDDGDEYNFVTHAFRHTISTELYRLGMSSTLIQIGILHHKEIQMSMKYIEIDAETQRQARKSVGLNAKSDLTDKVISENSTALPNGFCGMPHMMHCPNMNACLTCEFFRTSIEFLDVHKQYLETVNERIKSYETNEYKQNLAFALEEKRHLELIIAKLEEIGGNSHVTECNKTTS